MECFEICNVFFGRLDGMPQNCSICLGPLDKELAIISCGHVFHRDCLEDSMRFKAKCPECVTAVDVTRRDASVPSRSACHMVIPIFYDSTTERADNGAGQVNPLSPAEDVVEESAMSKEQLLDRLNAARERDKQLQRRLEVADEDLMEAKTEQIGVAGDLADARAMIQVLDEARDAADQGRRGAQGMLTTSKAEVKTLKRELKDYTKLK
eukprot:gene21554-12680_t